MMDWNASPELMARLRAAIKPVEPTAPLRETLAQDFPRDCARLPITGGWGRAKERAVVFVRTPTPFSAPRRFEGIEDLVVERIVLEELITFQPFDARFTGIVVGVKARHRLKEARTYDLLTAAVDCWSETHWQHLENEYVAHDRGRDPAFDIDAHMAKRAASQITYEREFWFDITDVLDGEGRG